MYCMINELNKRDVNLVTLEDPVEYNVEGVNQVQINEKVGMTFASGLRAILRQDPDIIAVGEIRDGETAEIAMRSAITGHVVLSTIHTNDAVGTIERLIDIGVEPYLVASAMQGMVSQRLLRRICPNCREAYTPSEDELRELGMEGQEGVQLYHGTGCPHCFDTGYRGRTRDPDHDPDAAPSCGGEKAPGRDRAGTEKAGERLYLDPRERSEARARRNHHAGGDPPRDQRRGLSRRGEIRRNET